MFDKINGMTWDKSIKSDEFWNGVNSLLRDIFTTLVIA